MIFIKNSTIYLLMHMLQNATKCDKIITANINKSNILGGSILWGQYVKRL